VVNIENFLSSGLVIQTFLTARYEKAILWGMPELTKARNDLILFISQILVVYLVISISLYNLSCTDGNKELWIFLMNSCIEYILPAPKLRKIVSNSFR